jgi:ribose transport system ATP-binding protein
LLKVNALSKSFIGQKALDQVSLEVAPGEVHALLGHNGSGKSTLIKVLAGFHEPDPSSGESSVDGRPLRPGDPESSRQAGLRFVHQELGLIDGLTVLENLRLGTGTYQTGAAWRIKWRAERRSVKVLLDRLDLHIAPDARFGDLLPVQRTEIAIARCVQDEDSAKVLVLDEPTAALPNREVDRLFAIVRRLAARGISVLYVTHRLEEVADIADRVTVLRDGQVVGSGPVEEFPRSRLVSLIIGTASTGPASRIEQLGPVERQPCLTVRNLHAGELHGLDLTLNQGDVLGIAGLAGSGVNDVPAALCGRIRVRSGSVTRPGHGPLRLAPPDLKRAGIAVLLAGRPLKSIQTMTVTENLTLTVLRRFWRKGIFRHRLERSFAQGVTRSFGVRPEAPDRVLATLSGGNQQKVCVARSLQPNPAVLILDEPTQGVDIGGKQEIIQILQRAAATGRGVMLCSSDLSDLASACDRVIVVRDGRAAVELLGADITRERITAECYGSAAAA